MKKFFMKQGCYRIWDYLKYYKNDKKPKSNKLNIT